MTQDEALAILKTGANVFLTGEPGSGKTHTVNQYVAWLRSHGMEPAVTASTGIAATHVNGHTIHSWSGIGVRNHLSRSDISRIEGNKRVSGRIRNTHTLVIDEISMLSARTFALAEFACRMVRSAGDPFGAAYDKPFGGLQVVLVGDFFQLPPVVRREEGEFREPTIFEDGRDAQSIFAFSSSAWDALDPTICYLSEQHRQEDPVFLDLLSAIRSQNVSSAHRALLETRLASRGADNVTQFFSHNADVDILNSSKLSRLIGEARTFAMETRGAKDLVERLKKGCLSPEMLTLKIGARVMFTKNDVAQHRFVNGTLGMVVGFSEEGSPIVQTNAGRTIFAEPADWSIEEGGRIVAGVKQIPLRLAWAITVHKSQGMSLDAAHMDLRDAFEHGQGYVAISRVRTLAGLSLAGFNERALEVHPEIAIKDAEFREASQTARENFANLPAVELEDRHNAFIKSCGGKMAPVAATTADEKTEIPAEQGMVEQKKTYSLAAIREKYPNAYRPWRKEEDADLLRQHEVGAKPKEIATALGRQPGAIRGRLAKLGLV